MTMVTGIGHTGTQTQSSTASSSCSVKLSNRYFFVFLTTPTELTTKNSFVMAHQGYIHHFKDTTQLLDILYSDKYRRNLCKVCQYS
jgi:hypothetical protein